MGFTLLLFGGIALCFVLILAFLRLLMGALLFFETALNILSEPPFHYLLLPFYLLYKVMALPFHYLGRLWRRAFFA